MARSKEAFVWKDGNIPDCKVHSKIKLDLLRTYLLSYFNTITANPKIDAINVHLIDAFSGGGILKDSITKELVSGSPLVMIQSVIESCNLIGAQRKKPFRINARYHFADIEKSATNKLLEVLSDLDLLREIEPHCLNIDTLSFDKFLPVVLGRIPSKQKTKAIFFLDQKGWSDATLIHCNQILSHLPKAEIIWNISIESLATFANEDDKFRNSVKKFGVELDDAFTSLPSYSHYSDWRKSLIALFLKQIRANCIAQYVSPFMIQHDGWGYWLLHLSNHPQANNVMKGTHWQHHNGSLHEGFPGLKMLEFNRENWNHTRMWRFDEEAESATHDALVDELGQRIKALQGDPTVSSLLKSIANDTPADYPRIFQSLDTLRRESGLSIRGMNGEIRRSIPQSEDDVLILPKNKQLILPKTID